MSFELTTISDVEVIHETDLAMLIEFDYGSEPVDGVNRFWIPLNLIERRVDYVEGFTYEDDDGEECEGSRDIVDIDIPDWFVLKTDGLADAIEATQN